jgi:hypothetical protein
MDDYTAECIARDMAGMECDPPCPYCGGYPDRFVDAIPWDYIRTVMQDAFRFTDFDSESLDGVIAWYAANRPQEDK